MTRAATSQARILRQRRFWGVLLGGMGIGLLYPLSIVTLLGPSAIRDAGRWIVHDPGFVVNLCLLVPIGAAVLVASFDVDLLKRMPRRPRTVLLLLLVFLFIAALIVFLTDLGRGGVTKETDLGRGGVTKETRQGSATVIEPPPRFTDFEAALRLEQEARKALEALRSARSEAAAKAEKPHEVERDPTVREARKRLGEAVIAYQKEFPSLNGFRDVFLDRGSWVARIAFVQNAYAGLFIGVIFWALITMIVAERPRPENDSYTWLCLIVGVLIFWYPLRLYSEWYRSFGQINVAGYAALVFLIVIGVALVLMLFFLLAKGTIQRVAILITSSVGFLSTVIASFKPEMLGWLERSLESLGVELYSLLVAVLATALVAMAYAVVRDR